MPSTIDQISDAAVTKAGPWALIAFSVWRFLLADRTAAGINATLREELTRVNAELAELRTHVETCDRANRQLMTAMVRAGMDIPDLDHN